MKLIYLTKKITLKTKQKKARKRKKDTYVLILIMNVKISGNFHWNTRSYVVSFKN